MEGTLWLAPACAAATALLIVLRARAAAEGSAEEEAKEAKKAPLLRFGSTRATNNPPWIDPIEGWLRQDPSNRNLNRRTPWGRLEIPVVAFGEDTRAQHFAGLDPTLPAFLNHGSYGSALTVASRAAARWGAALERQPVQFMESEVLPELCDTLVRVSRDILGEPGALNTVAFVPNATYAVNSVARSVIVSSGRIKKGDVVLCFGKSYGACVSALDLACRDVGATLARVRVRCCCGPGEEDDDALVHDFEAALDATDCKFALIDLITSMPPRRLPVERLCKICRDRGILTLCDAAHGIGCAELPAAIRDLGADFLCTNLHKWYCTPKGTALLWVRGDSVPIFPASVSHGHGRGFSCEFIWQASKNYGPYLSLKEAMIWHNAYGGLKMVRERNQALVARGARRLARIIPGARCMSTTSPRRKKLNQYDNALCLAVVELPESVPSEYVPPAAELAPTSMEKCRASLDVLRARGVNTVVWDMDHTMSAMHCGDGLALSELDAYVDATSKDFVALSRALAFYRPEFQQAVATGSDPAEYELPGHSRCSHILGPDLARTIIRRRCCSGGRYMLEANGNATTGVNTTANADAASDVLQSFDIMVGFDYRLHKESFPGAEAVNRKGKRHHMRRIAHHYGCRFEEMLLLDDSPSSLENEDGWRGLRVRDRKVGFRFRDLLGEDWDPLEGLGQAPSVPIRDGDGLVDPMKLHFALRERGIEAVTFRNQDTGRLGTRLSASSYNCEREYEFLAFHLLDLLRV